jgi:hypothetical protein
MKLDMRYIMTRRSAAHNRKIGDIDIALALEAAAAQFEPLISENLLSMCDDLVENPGTTTAKWELLIDTVHERNIVQADAALKHSMPY